VADVVGTGTEATCVRVESDLDIVTARQVGRTAARELGFTSGNATLVATAISELARNIVQYATCGEVVVRRVMNGDRQGLVVTARDEGPGITDVTRALQDGFSTSGRLGLGLPGVRRVMDGFEIRSARGEGTTVTVTKWNT
jgi:serine/threonine-protein kinase RsbT